MKQSFFLMMLLISLFTSAQKKKETLSFLTSLEINQLRTLGGSLSMHSPFSKLFSIGAGIDLIRVRNTSKNVVPIYLDTRFNFQVKNIQPFLFLQGGIPAYNELLSGPANTNLSLIHISEPTRPY